MILIILFYNKQTPKENEFLMVTCLQIGFDEENKLLIHFFLCARSGNEEKMMALLTPLNVNCHASDGRKVLPFATKFCIT